MTVIPFPLPEEPPRPAPDPLESALLSALNNAPEDMDSYRDDEDDEPT